MSLKHFFEELDKRIWQGYQRPHSRDIRWQLSSGTSRRGTFCTCVLLIGMTLCQIGCSEKADDRFTFPENPTPLPDPSSRMDNNKKAAPTTPATINQR